MLDGVLLMGSLGLVVGIGLAIASKIFYVWVDPRVEAINEAFRDVVAEIKNYYIQIIINNYQTLNKLKYNERTKPGSY